MPFADPKQLTENDKFGCQHSETLAAVDRMQPELQKLINQNASGEAILAAFGAGFFDALEKTGYPVAHHADFVRGALRSFADELETKNGRKRLPARVRKPANAIFTLNRQLFEEGHPPIAIAWSYAGAIRNLSRRLPYVTLAETDKLVEDLIRHINAGRGYLSERIPN